MLKLKIIIFISLSLCSQFIFAEEQTYIRDYSYQASDTDSKVSARNASLLFLKQNLLSEIGTYVGSSINIVSVASGSEGVTVSAGQVKSLTEGYIKTEILEQKWNGVTFYIKAKLKADPDEIAAKLKSIAESSNTAKSESSEEFEYWKSVVQIDSNEGYLNYMKKYPKGKYQELAEIAVVRLLKEKMEKRKNNKWLVKPESKVLIVSRHDTGTVNDTDPDEMTLEMAKTMKKGLSNYLPSNVKIKMLLDFDETEDFFYEYKEMSASLCAKQQADLVVGAILEDHEGFQGRLRPVKMFVRNCEKNAFKFTRFVPKGTSNEDFWRRNDVQKNLRVLIQDYFDTV